MRTTEKWPCFTFLGMSLTPRLVGDSRTFPSGSTFSLLRYVALADVCERESDLTLIGSRKREDLRDPRKALVDP